MGGIGLGGGDKQNHSDVGESREIFRIGEDWQIWVGRSAGWGRGRELKIP